MAMVSAENCGVCGAALACHTARATMTCACCGERFEALISCSDGHPRRCKRSGREALSAGVAFLREHLGLSLADEPVSRYEFHRRNAECPAADCAYRAPHPGPASPARRATD